MEALRRKMFRSRMRDGNRHGRNIWRGDEEQVKDWLKRRKHDMRRECSVFLELVLVLTGIPFPDGRWTVHGLFYLMTIPGMQRMTG